MKTKLLLTCAVLFTAILAYAQNTFLWRIENPKNQFVSYITGTHHLLTDHYLNTFPIISQKISEATTVVFEVDQDDVQDQNKALLARPENAELKKLLTEEQKEKVVKYLGRDALKQTPVGLVAMISVFNTVSNHPSSKGENIEIALKKIAEANSKNIIYLETGKQQFDAVTESQSGGLTAFLAKSSLNQMVRELGNTVVKKEPNKSISKYYDQKHDYFLNRGIFTKYHTAILKDRNENWMKKLPGIIDSRNTFISVGTMHLQYSVGLISLLRKLGYKLTPVDMKTGKDLPFNH